MRHIALIIILLLVSCNNNSIKKNSIKSSDISTSPDEISGKKVYVNPADGKTYESENEWKTYSPQNKKIDTGNVKIKQIILLTNQNEISNRISVERLTEFIEKTEVIVKESMTKSHKKGELLVQITLSNYKAPKVNISAKDDVDGEKVSSIYYKIEKLKNYTTQKDSVTFQTHYTIN